MSVATLNASSQRSEIPTDAHYHAQSNDRKHHKKRSGLLGRSSSTKIPSYSRRSHLSTSGIPLLPLKSKSTHTTTSIQNKRPSDFRPQVPSLASFLSPDNGQSKKAGTEHSRASEMARTPHYGSSTNLPPVIQALTFDHIFGETTPPHPTPSTHVQTRQSVLGDTDQISPPPPGTPTITIASLDQKQVAGDEIRGHQQDTSTTDSCCPIKRASRKNYLTVEQRSSSGKVCEGERTLTISTGSLKDDRTRKRSLLDSSNNHQHRIRSQTKVVRNVLISPRSQGSTVGTRSATSSHRSGKSSRSTTPLERNRQQSEKDLARQRTQYTGPGFASLPPALARSPTSKLLTQKSQFLNDSDSENQSNNQIEHTASSVSSSTVTPISQADRPFSQTTKSSTLQSIPESQFQQPLIKDISHTPTTSRSGTPIITPKKVDQRKLLFRRLFGGDSTTIKSPNKSDLLKQDSADSYREVTHSESAVDPDRKTFGRRALSIIGIGNETRKATNNFESVIDQQSSKGSSERKTLFKRASLRSKKPLSRIETNQSPNSNIFHRLKSTLDHYSTSHNANMGNTIPNCCGGRPETAAKEAAKDDDTARNFLAAQGGQTDLDKFDRAYAEDDIATLVSLVGSKEAFEQPLEENLHPWAATPRSVGALATTQLAALASVEDTAVKERLRVAGAIPILVEQLSSPQEDRRDAALVALSFLSIDYARACMDMFEAGIFAPLIELLKSPKTGVKAAAAQTARNIYVLEVRYRRAFRDAGGCQPLVDLLDLPQGKYDSSMLDVQLEAVYHIDDFIMFNGEEVSDCIAAIKVCNTARKLEQLQNVDQEDLREAARLLFLRVAE